MREVVGSFAQLKNVGSVIRGEMVTHLRRRQVVSILLIKPDGKALCLCVAEGAIKDKRLNLSPPQGGIESGELLYGATARELHEELNVNIVGRVMYLGSVLRILSGNHRHSTQFDDCHHHWVGVFAGTDKLRPRDSQAEACWHYLDTLESLSQVSMSKEKAFMFNAARRQLLHISKDPYLIRQDQFAINNTMVA